MIQIIIDMKKRLLFVGFALFSCLFHSQSKSNQSLKIELDSILKSDQILREYMDSSTSTVRQKEILKEVGRENDPNFRGKIWMIINTQDSINMIKGDKIILHYGYPGKSLVGEPTDESAWCVIQHSKKLKNIFL